MTYSCRAGCTARIFTWGCARSTGAPCLATCLTCSELFLVHIPPWFGTIGVIPIQICGLVNIGKSVGKFTFSLVAWQAGVHGAHLLLGLRAIDGRGVPRNLSEALRHLRAAAGGGEPQALLSLGLAE